jgi:hypothetical protein
VLRGELVEAMLAQERHDPVAVLRAVVGQRLVQSEKLAPRTLADYRSKNRHWIVPLPGKHRLDKLAPEHLDAAYTTMERGLSTSTVLKIHRILSRALIRETRLAA